MKTFESLLFKGNFVANEFVQPKSADESWTKWSPSHLSEKVIDIETQYSDIEVIVDNAQTAFKAWKKNSLSERLVYINKLKEVFTKRKNDIATIISRETGKPFWEGQREAGALVAKINVTLEYSLDLVKDQTLENALPGVTGRIRHKSKGVMVVLGPFNFPAHLPNGHWISALALGNTVIFKPSDKTPGVGQILAECFQEAEFPRGVFQMIQGGAEVGKRLVQHDSIDGVLFTGSYDVGLKIKQDTLHQYWKVLALEMGGKNSTLIWKDADIKKAVYESIQGAFLTTGQRCSCTSRLFLHEDIFDEFVGTFHLMAKSLKVGHWSQDVFMGPLIDKTAVEKYIRFQEIAKREGAESLMRGKLLNQDQDGYYVSPSINIVDRFDPGSVYQKSEIFGPNVALFKVSDFDEAISQLNGTQYGLSSAIFTKDRALYEKAFEDLDVGLLNWNRTTNGASSRLPFGGTKKSGNHRPTAHYAPYYCVTPVSCLEDLTEFEGEIKLPGVSWPENI